MDSSMDSFNRPVTSNIYVAVLRKDVPSPLAPESDEEGQGKVETGKTEASKTDTAKAETAKTDGQEREKPKPPEPVKVDFEKRSEERRVGKECRSRWSRYH